MDLSSTQAASINAGSLMSAALVSKIMILDIESSYFKANK